MTGTGIVAQSTRNGTLTLERKAPAQKLDRADPPVPPSAELSRMVVTDTADGADPPYQAEISTAGTKMPVEITRIPQGIQVITETAIEDRGAVSIGDIVKQVPSASVFGSRYSRFPAVNIRGFRADRVRNGIRQEFLPDSNDFSALSHIQSIEILKGPGSTAFGQGGDGGGIINVVTKRPYDWFGAEVSFTRGGWDGFDGDITSGQWDLNAPLTPDGALKARFTGEIEVPTRSSITRS